MVIQKSIPPTPNEFSIQEEKDAHSQWQRENEKVQCIILGSLNNVFQ